MEKLLGEQKNNGRDHEKQVLKKFDKGDGHFNSSTTTSYARYE